MSKQVVACHNKAHGVSSHIAGSAAAKACAESRGKGGYSPRAHHLPSPKTNYSLVSNPISRYDQMIKEIGDGEYRIQTSFQITANDEDMAYEIAAECFPELEDAGITVENIEDDVYDVVSSVIFKGDGIPEAKGFMKEQFILPPRYRAVMADLIAASDGR